MNFTPKKTILLIVIILIIAIIGAYLSAIRQSRQQSGARNNGENGQNETRGLVQKKEVEASQAPEKFPANVPIERDAKITQNYNATTPDGRFQATRVFETNQTLAANLKLYSDFLKNDGWQILATVDQPNFKMVMGSKGKQHLQIQIDENSVSKVKTVSINMTEVK
ncbi:MAG: hypothetical protein M3Q64_00495 [bacterium]|nr:hypothetical protein [bacterium]